MLQYNVLISVSFGRETVMFVWEQWFLVRKKKITRVS
jgi:hypothetical protein